MKSRRLHLKQFMLPLPTNQTAKICRLIFQLVSKSRLENMYQLQNAARRLSTLVCSLNRTNRTLCLLFPFRVIAVKHKFHHRKFRDAKFNRELCKALKIEIRYLGDPSTASCRTKAPKSQQFLVQIQLASNHIEQKLYQYLRALIEF